MVAFLVLFAELTNDDRAALDALIPNADANAQGQFLRSALRTFQFVLSQLATHCY